MTQMSNSAILRHNFSGYASALRPKAFLSDPYSANPPQPYPPHSFDNSIAKILYLSPYIKITDISDHFQFIHSVYFNQIDIGEGYIMLENKSAQIIATGKGIKGARKELAKTIEMLWEYYAQEEDSVLTEDAKCLKQWLLQHIKTKG